MSETNIAPQIKTWLEIITIIITGSVFIDLFHDPEDLKRWCDKGGFSECIFFGAKYQPTEKQKEAFQAAEQTLGDSKAQFKAVSEELQTIKAEYAALLPSCKLNEAERVKISASLKSSEAIIASSTASIASGLSQLSPIVSQIAPEGKWAIVFGGDSKHKSALDEISKAKQFKTAQIVYRQKSYRSVVIFESRDTAKEQLPLIKEFSMLKDAYIVNFDNWCISPTPQKDEFGPFTQCINS